MSSQILLFAILVVLIGAALEVLTLALRLVLHLKAKQVQNHIHMPRIHHSELGVMLLLIYYFYNSEVYIVIFGWALVLSDLTHHLIVLPIIKKRGYDIHMIHHRHLHIYFRRILGPILFILGLIALLTPFTPGSWLMFPGLLFVIGRNKTESLLVKILGIKVYEKFRLVKFVNRLSH